MAKLEEIPRKKFFTVPEDYFEKLPSRIQARMAEKGKSRAAVLVNRYSLTFALATIVVISCLFYYHSLKPDAESILATVESDELVEYLQDTGMSTEEILEKVEFTREDLGTFENEVYDFSFDDIEELN